MENSKLNTGDWQARTNKKKWRLAGWTFAWVLTVALATFGPEFLWDQNTLISAAAVLLSLGVGAGMIVANIRYLNEQDELMQKVQLEAMGITLGVAVVGGLGFSMLDIANVIPFDAEIGYMVMIIGVTYLISLVINMRRYK